MAAAMVVMLLLPTTTKAQTKMDGFIDNSFSTDYFDRGDEWLYTIVNQQFGQNNEPLGSGLIIMTLAGAGYVLLRKKED